MLTPEIHTWPEPQPPVLTKADFVRRYIRGEFGNRAPTWDTLEEFALSGYHGLVHIRNRVVGGPTWYNVPHDCVATVFHDQVVGCDRRRDDFYFSGMAPHDKNLLQGEVQRRGDLGLALTYTTAPGLAMRDALAQCTQHARGLRAIMLLRANLCPTSYDWMQHLLGAYDGHVIEFSAFSTNWGTLPHHNTVFWEVRCY